MTSCLGLGNLNGQPHHHHQAGVDRQAKARHFASPSTAPQLNQDECTWLNCGAVERQASFSGHDLATTFSTHSYTCSFPFLGSKPDINMDDTIHGHNTTLLNIVYPLPACKPSLSCLPCQDKIVMFTQIHTPRTNFQLPLNWRFKNVRLTKVSGEKYLKSV